MINTYLNDLDAFISANDAVANVPHHPEINSFPDHLHDGAVDNVKSFRKCSALDILTGIINEIVTL